MSPRVEAAVLAIGDELLAGAHPDLNTPEIARTLAAIGIPMGESALVGDDPDPIAGAVGRLAARYPLVFTTGGLGPTLDDVTRHAIAQAAGVQVVESEAALLQVEATFRSRGRSMPASNRRQALVPAGSDIVPNNRGTAPGFRIAIGPCTVIALPGPPSELRGMLSESVVPYLSDRFGAPALQTERLFLFGLPESVLADRVGDWMERDADPLLGCSAKGGVLALTLRANPDAAGNSGGRSPQEGRALLEEMFAEFVFSREEPHLEQALGKELIARGVSIATAESCTGGLIAARLAGVPGISDVLEEAFVTYSNASKIARLGLDPALLEECGAVSSEVAVAMAEGASERAGTRLAVAVTGIAGPGGGSDEKPVGLVHLATCLDGITASEEVRFPPLGRNWVRDLAANRALFLCLQRVRSLEE